MFQAPVNYIQVDANAFFNDLWQIPSHASHNPSPTPVTLRRQDLNAWKKPYTKHLVTEKSDGERVTLLFGRTDDIKEEPYAVLFRRNRDILYLPVSNVNDELYDGTMLDGEWLGTHFRIFDVVAVKGFSKKKNPFPERLNDAKVILTEFTPNGWTVDVKTFYAVDQLSVLQSDIDEGKKGKCDGLIFMPVDDAVTMGRAHNIKKWKPTMQNTIDLFHQNGEWSCVGTDGNLSPFSLTLNGGTNKEGIFELKPILVNNTLVWEIYGHRTDKKVPNHISTIRLTLETIAENITMDDLLACF